MAQKVQTVSDLDGADDANFGVVVRDYPDLDQAKLVDVTEAQADALIAKAVKDTVTCEIRSPDSGTREIKVARADFDEWAGGKGKGGELLNKAANLRGRRPGYSPAANGGGSRT